MIVYRKKFITIQEVWDDEEPRAAGVDLVRCFQQAEPLGRMTCREFYTILLDLRREEGELFAGIKKGTRYEIRRAAGQDGLAYEAFDAGDREVFAEFGDFYDRFAAQKGQPPLNRGWLSAMAAAHLITLTRVCEGAGATLVWHAYRRGRNRVTLLHSASLYRATTDKALRAKVGRANRYQHWRDILRFKAELVGLYDMGGWYKGETDEERLRINRFKEEFGGKVVRNYICERGLTLRGRLFLQLRQRLLGEAI